MAHPQGLEPRTPCLEGRCSIQLSYGCSPEDFTLIEVCRELAPRTIWVEYLEFGLRRLDQLESGKLLHVELFRLRQDRDLRDKVQNRIGWRLVSFLKHR